MALRGAVCSISQACLPLFRTSLFRPLQILSVNRTGLFSRSLSVSARLREEEEEKRKPRMVKVKKRFNSTPDGLIPEHPGMEEERTGRSYGFLPSPLPMPETETVWWGYERVFKGTKPPKKMRRRCHRVTKGRFMTYRKTSCAVCSSNERVEPSNVLFLRNFISPYSWSIYPNRKTGLCEYAQRHVTKAVEEARQCGFLPLQMPYWNAKRGWRPPGREMDTRIYYYNNQTKRIYYSFEKKSVYSRQTKRPLIK